MGTVFGTLVVDPKTELGEEIQNAFRYGTKSTISVSMEVKYEDITEDGTTIIYDTYSWDGMTTLYYPRADMIAVYGPVRISSLYSQNKNRTEYDWVAKVMYYNDLKTEHNAVMLHSNDTDRLTTVGGEDVQNTVLCMKSSNYNTEIEGKTLL